MAVTYTSAVKAARLGQVLSAIDAGTGSGFIEIGSAGMASVLATIGLSTTGGVVTSSLLTLAFATGSASASATGTAAAARIMSSAGITVATGLTVGTSGTDIVLDSVNITALQVVTLDSAVITHG